MREGKMDTLVKINETSKYKVCSFDFENFGHSTDTICLITDDFAAVKSDFSKIESLEVYNDNKLVGEYTIYDTYCQLTYSENQYDIASGTFCNVIKVTLTKANLIEQVRKLNDKINPVLDMDSMTVEEYKAHILKTIAEDCRNDIYNGMKISTSFGTKHFTYNEEDQQNLANAICVISQSHDNASLTIPFHAPGEICRLFPVADIIKIYSNLQTMLTAKTTYCNALNITVSSLDTKEALSKCYYGMALPEQQMEHVNSILSTANAIMKSFIANYLDDTEISDSNSEVEETTSSTIESNGDDHE